MRWYHSLITKITLLFILALIGIFILIFSLNRHLKEREIRNVTHIARLSFRYNKNDNGFDLKALKKEGFAYQKELKPQDLIKRYYRYHRRHPFRLRVISRKGDIFVIVRDEKSKYMVFKYIKSSQKFSYFIYFAGGIFAIFLLYIGIIRSILPLYRLRVNIKEFAKGSYEIDCKSNKKDEIGLLTNEFHHAVQKIRRLKNSRDLFLRNIMHELKTPIMKGKLALEMIEETQYKRVLENVFARQENLIEEFARIEKLSANELKLDIKRYNLEDIIDFAVDLIEDKEENIEKEILPMKIDADFELFGICLKNLLDNAVNYSHNSKAFIKNDKESITIFSKGERLKYPLEEYLKPCQIAEKREYKGGLGFGLYITLNIVKLHGFELEYEYEDSINYFKIMV